jgi:hypothetical protein
VSNSVENKKYVVTETFIIGKSHWESSVLPNLLFEIINLPDLVQIFIAGIERLILEQKRNFDALACPVHL